MVANGEILPMQTIIVKFRRNIEQGMFLNFRNNNFWKYGSYNTYILV